MVKLRIIISSVSEVFMILQLSYANKKQRDFNSSILFFQKNKSLNFAELQRKRGYYC